MKDALDYLMPKGRFTARGSYYKKKPNNPAEGAQAFSYEYVDPRSAAYRILYGSLQSFDAGEIAIRTRDRLGFKPNEFIVTADGALFTILSVEKDFSSAPKQALRTIGVPVGVHYLIRATKTKNPWGLT